MPFDTVIDKAQLEGAITASANAIREKTGDTALIEWLSDKGFAEAIAAIQAGGGALFEFGSVTFTNSTTKCDEYKITHNMGVKPAMIFLCRSSGNNGSAYLDFWWSRPNEETVDGKTHYVAYSSSSRYNGTRSSDVTENHFIIQSSSSWTFSAATYNWMAIANVEEWLK